MSVSCAAEVIFSPPVQNWLEAGDLTVITAGCPRITTVLRLPLVLGCSRRPCHVDCAP